MRVPGNPLGVLLMVVPEVSLSLQNCDGFVLAKSPARTSLSWLALSAVDQTPTSRIIPSKNEKVPVLLEPIKVVPASVFMADAFTIPIDTPLTKNSTNVVEPFGLIVAATWDQMPIGIFAGTAKSVKFALSLANVSVVPVTIKLQLGAPITLGREPNESGLIHAATLKLFGGG